jgi:type IV secretory pathway TraG/TraD family ATPase VirD4
MIPDGEGDSKEWNGYAQTFVTSVLRQLVERRMLSIKKLLYYVQAASIEELEPFLAGTPAAAQLVSERTFGSIRTIASNYLATYAYLEDNNTPFSVSQFIRRGKAGCLFFTYRDDQLDSLRNMISCALDIASRTILSLPDDPGRRVWLIIDEFASIGKVQSIEAFATKARKKGGCLLIGLQAVSQLQHRYGEKGAQTILSCLSSWLVLRCSDPETAEYISTYIGDSEISRMTRGESSSETGGSASLNEQIQTQRAVMPVELQRLANLAGFFKLAGDYPICRVALNFPKKRPKIATPYADRDFEAKPMLTLLASDTKPAVAPSAPVAPAPASNTGASGTQGGGVGMTQSSAPAQEVRREPMREAATPAELSGGLGAPIMTSMLDGGPQMLEDVLNDLADAFEHEG